METDLLVTVGKSLIQHGYYNNRIYLISLHPDDVGKVLDSISFLQLTCSYQKIILKVPRSLEKDFSTPDTCIEAQIPGYYQGIEDALFLSRFYDVTRSEDDAYDIIRQNIRTCQEREKSSVNKTSNGVVIREADISDIPLMCSLYQQVFETYPFPIHDPVHVQKTMNGGVPFFVGETKDGIVAAGSCEIDIYASAGEMSDIAVDTRYRGLGLSRFMLSFMEDKIKEKGVKTAYTICRAEPIQINRLFSGFDYEYGGTLVKNTNICGKCESMNIWYKKLQYSDF
ncbi:MAG: putative beta-lysine N-acetyltransferase [Methanomicrobiales archaeon]|nr:putative beta-lysine N-acetyltransferase [Methanomicrobiales archaeon]